MVLAGRVPHAAHICIQKQQHRKNEIAKSIRSDDFTIAMVASFYAEKIEQAEVVFPKMT